MSKNPKISPEIEEVIKLLRNGKTREEIAEIMDVSVWKARKMITQAKTILEGIPRVGIDPSDPLFRSEVLRRIKKPITPEQLAKDMSAQLSDVENVLTDLEEHGFIIEKRGSTIQLGKSVEHGTDGIVLDNHLYGEPIKFGVVTDMHLGNKNARLDVLTAAYDMFAERGVNTVFCAGNYVDGEFRFNRHELLVHGIADQCQYAIDNWPQRNGIVTYYVDGDDHEGWWQQREGLEFGRYLQLEAQAQGREDLQYMGYMEADIEIKAPKGSCVVKTMHPGGGTAYALSYASQKLVESLQGGEKPAVILAGHYHKFDYCYPRNVHVVQCGCVCDQTRFMRKKKIEAHVGFVICTLHQDIAGGVSRFIPEFFPFYDRGYYFKRDEVANRLKGG
jgi:predicted phosphodiesterase